MSLCLRISLIAILLGVSKEGRRPSVAAERHAARCVYRSEVAQARLDPATGTISGVIADIARELGRRADVPVSITPLPTAAAVLDAVRTGQADIGFVAPNPERTGVVLYSRTYMLVQQSALVRANSPLRSVKELDRPGQVIGANTDDSVGVWLKQRLTAAKVRETPDYTLRDAVQWLRNGDVIAFAGGRQRLSSGTRGVPGLRMLDDNFYGVPQAVAVPLDREDRLQLVNAALGEMRSSGFRRTPSHAAASKGLRLRRPRRRSGDRRRPEELAELRPR